jgi:hypothetical protein
MKTVERRLTMLIITYFLIFVLLISLMIILVPYFKAFLRENKQLKPGIGREEFSAEFFPDKPKKETPIDYNWKAHLNKELDFGELPQTYRDNRLVLMVKNSHNLYAYWDTTTRWDRGTPVLRVYELNPSGEEKDISFLFDIDLEKNADNWFFPVPKDNWMYYVELGRREPDGKFIPLLRSNPVTTPRASLSPAIDENWIPCDLYGRLNNISYGLSSGYMHKERERTDH